IIYHDALHLRTCASVIKYAVDRKTAAGGDGGIDKDLVCDIDRRLIIKRVVVRAEKTADSIRPDPRPLAQYFQRFKAVCEYRIRAVVWQNLQKLCDRTASVYI